MRSHGGQSAVYTATALKPPYTFNLRNWLNVFWVFSSKEIFDSLLGRSTQRVLCRNWIGVRRQDVETDDLSCRQTRGTQKSTLVRAALTLQRSAGLKRFDGKKRKTRILKVETARWDDVHIPLRALARACIGLSVNVCGLYAWVRVCDIMWMHLCVNVIVFLPVFICARAYMHGVRRAFAGACWMCDHFWEVDTYACFVVATYFLCVRWADGPVCARAHACDGYDDQSPEVIGRWINSVIDDVFTELHITSMCPKREKVDNRLVGVRCRRHVISVTAIWGERRLSNGLNQSDPFKYGFAVFNGRFKNMINMLVCKEII